MATVIDTLVTRLQFKSNTAELGRAERRLQTFRQRAKATTAAIGREAAKIGRTAVLIGVAVGGAAFVQGRVVAKAQLRQQTQLGETAESVERTGAVIKEFSRESTVSLGSLEDAFFNVKSAVPGIDEAAALKIVERASKAAAIQLGDANDLALIGAQAYKFYGTEAATFFDLFQKTVELGTIPDTAAFARSVGPLIALGSQAGIPLEEIFASIAGLSSQFPIGQAINSIENVVRQLYAPTTEALPILATIFGPDPLQGLRESITQKGLISTLRTMASVLGDDTVAFRKVIGTSEGLTFALDVSGKQAESYNETFRQVREEVGGLDSAFDVLTNSSLYDADQATNAIAISMVELYNSALVPILKIFGDLPPKIQQVTLALVGASVASQIMGGVGIGTILKGIVLLIPRLIIATGAVALWAFSAAIATPATVAFALAVRGVGAAFRFLWVQGQYWRWAS